MLTILSPRPSPRPMPPADDAMLGALQRIAEHVREGVATAEEVTCLCHAAPELLEELRGWRRHAASVRAVAEGLRARVANGAAPETAA